MGPAIAFLYSGPAINILAVVYSARLLGYDLGMARAVGAVVFSVIIGMIMAFVWRREESQKASKPVELALPQEEEKARPQGITLSYFAILVGILVFGAAGKWLVTGILLLVLGLVLYRWFDRGELSQVLAKGTFDKEQKVIKLLAEMFSQSKSEEKNGN